MHVCTNRKLTLFIIEFDPLTLNNKDQFLFFKICLYYCRGRGLGTPRRSPRFYNIGVNFQLL